MNSGHPHVQTGLEVLVRDELHRLEGRRAALLANPTAVDRQLRHACDLLLNRGANLVRLFGPEHGLGGEAQDMEPVTSVRHPRYGVPVWSLYGTSVESLRPPPDSLEGLDLLIIDLQDIGSRYYTYVWTALMALEACCEAGIETLVLDRPNPLGGGKVEGPGIDDGFTSFVGTHSVPVRHGLTLGELLLLSADERGLSPKPTIIPARGWSREQLFDETGLPWILPSPNMPTLDTALVYPGGCLLEGTNVSEGRGTTRPFEIFGAPWIDGWALAEALEGQDLPGVCFRPLSFSPMFHKHARRACGGVQLHVTDRRAFQPFMTGVAILAQLRRLWPEELIWRDQAYEFVTDHPAIDLLAGGPWLRRGVDAGADLHALTAGWGSSVERFCERRRPYLLY